MQGPIKRPFQTSCNTWDTQSQQAFKEPSWPPPWPPHFHDFHILTDSLEQAKQDIFIAVNYFDEPAVCGYKSLMGVVAGTVIEYMSVELWEDTRKE